jgi:hypothetical protein
MLNGWLAWLSSRRPKDKRWKRRHFAESRHCRRESLLPSTKIHRTQSVFKLAYELSKQGIIEAGSSLSVRSMIHQALYTPHQWAGFANFTLAPLLSNLTRVSQQATSTGPGRRKRGDDGIDLSILKRQQSSFESSPAPDYTFQAISCGDSVDPGSTTTQMVFDELVRVAKDVSGFCMPYLSFRYYIVAHHDLVAPQFPQPAHECHLWPFRAAERYAGPFNAQLPNPMLVIGNTADPTTPFKSAKLVADAFGDSATLIEQRGFGVCACRLL